MNPERWQQLSELFHAALERAPEERAAFLDEACAGEDELRKQVEDFLAAHEQAGSFIESPAIEVAARGVAADRENPEAELASGETVSHYRIISPLGSGGMGDVYLAQDTVLSRQVALKLLPEHFTRDTDRLRRFQQESRAASALNHPNIITIYEIGQVDDRHFIATEFIDGETLRQNFFGEGKHTSGKQLRLRDVLDIAIQTADALAAAHEAGIVHRDIKPENIMVRRRDGYVKVLDFGLAKLTEGEVDSEAPTRAQIKTSAGVVMGTVTYMSPEQARGEQVDVRTDIWSLGVVLYEMVAGSAPFGRSTPSEVIALILEREPAPLARYAREVPSELERIVSKALTKDREERYQTAKDLLVDLRRLRQRLEVKAEIERTTEPHENSRAEKAVATGSEQAVAVTAKAATLETGDAAAAQATSTGAYLVKEIKLPKRGALIVLAALVAVTAVAAYFAYSRYARGSRVGTIRSVAVMPFINASGNSDVDYLSDGLTESLITSLSQLPKLSVKARSSVFRYKGKEAPPQQVGKELNVQAILNGRVVKRGDDLTLHIELVDVDTETALWSGDYNRSMTNLVSLPSEIALDVSSKLRLKLSGTDEQRLAKTTYTANAEAYQLYLKGRYHYFKLTEPEIRKSIALYKQAIDVDATYALAYAEMADAYRTLPIAYYAPSKEAFPQAKSAAIRALEIDENLAEAHIALGWVGFLFDWDWSAAESQLKRAIELSPNNSDAHRAYAHLLSLLGRHAEAIVEAKRARELEPLTLITNALEGQFLFYAGRSDEAIARLKTTLEIDAKFWIAHNILGRVYISQGRYDEAIAELKIAKELSGGSTEPITQLGYALAKSGKREQAQGTLEELRLLAAENYVPEYDFAMVYNGLGEKDEALKYLEKSFQDREVGMAFIKIDWRWDDLRAEPRFQALLRRVGFTP